MKSLLPTALFSDDPAHGETHSEPVVRRGGATTRAEKPKRLVSPAAFHSDDRAHPATHAGRVVRGGGATTRPEQPISNVSPAATNSDGQVQGGTQGAPVVSRGRGQVRHDTQAGPASSSKNYNGLKAIVGEADRVHRDTHTEAVGFPVSIPNDHSPTETQVVCVVGGEASQLIADTQKRGAGLSDLLPDDQCRPETHQVHVAGREASHYASDIQIANAGLSTLIEEIREQWRRRQVWHRAEKSLTLQAKATCRRLVEGDKIKANALFKAAHEKCDGELEEVAFAATFPLVEAGKSVELHRKAVEKRLLKLAAQLPIAEFILGLRGVGLLSLAGIIGEAGDLSIYPNPAKLWKRMGVGLVDGGRQRRLLDKEAALRHGYSPSRRSHMWNIGSCIIKAGGPLKDLYVERKEYELTKPETASKLHAHRKAQRYVEKRLLREMWCEWRKH